MSQAGKVKAKPGLTEEKPVASIKGNPEAMSGATQFDKLVCVSCSVCKYLKMTI